MYSGGKLYRLIGDNFYNMIHDSLEDLGWFNPARKHLPVHLIPEPVEDNEAIQLNTIAISDEEITTSDVELGSVLAEHRLLFYIDIYAESKAIGRHLSGDIKDILEGRMNSIGRGSPTVTVMDLSLATPTELLVCQIESVAVERGRAYLKKHQQFWYSVMCELVFSFQSDLD